MRLLRVARRTCRSRCTSCCSTRSPNGSSSRRPASATRRGCSTRCGRTTPTGSTCARRSASSIPPTSPSRRCATTPIFVDQIQTRRRGGDEQARRRDARTRGRLPDVGERPVPAEAADRRHDARPARPRVARPDRERRAAAAVPGAHSDERAGRQPPDSGQRTEHGAAIPPLPSPPGVRPACCGWVFDPADVFDEAKLLALLGSAPDVTRLKGVFRAAGRVDRGEPRRDGGERRPRPRTAATAASKCSPTRSTGTRSSATAALLGLPKLVTARPPVWYNSTHPPTRLRISPETLHARRTLPPPRRPRRLFRLRPRRRSRYSGGRRPRRADVAAAASRPRCRRSSSRRATTSASSATRWPSGCSTTAGSKRYLHARFPEHDLVDPQPRLLRRRADDAAAVAGLRHARPVARRQRPDPAAEQARATRASCRRTASR